jgi:hypothetical protein
MSSKNDRDRRGSTRQNKENKRVENSEQQVSDNCIVFPLSKDVLLGRGRNHFFHPGNRQFREVVGMNYGAYLNAETKSQKSIIVNKIVNEALAQGARFLEQDSNSKLWYDIGVKRVRDKVRGTQLRFLITKCSTVVSKSQVTTLDFGQVGHALRDASSDKNQSIRSIHLDLIQRTMLEPEPARHDNSSATDLPDLSIVYTSTALSSLIRRESPGIVATSNKNEGIDRDSEYQVTKSHDEIDDQSNNEHEGYSSSSVASLNPSVLRILPSSKELSAKGILYQTKDCGTSEEIKNLSKRKSSSRLSSGSILDACLDVINEMNGDELDECLEAAGSKLH